METIYSVLHRTLFAELTKIICNNFAVKISFIIVIMMFFQGYLGRDVIIAS